MRPAIELLAAGQAVLEDDLVALGYAFGQGPDLVEDVLAVPLADDLEPELADRQSAEGGTTRRLRDDRTRPRGTATRFRRR